MVWPVTACKYLRQPKLFEVYVTCQVNFANVRSNFALPRQLSGNAQKIIIGSVMYVPVYQKVVHPNGANTQSQLLDQFHTASVNTDSCNNSQKMITDITLSECEGCGSCPSAK